MFKHKCNLNMNNFGGSHHPVAFPGLPRESTITALQYIIPGRTLNGIDRGGSWLFKHEEL